MKGLLVFSHHMEDGEALTTRALLRRAGLDIHSITFESTKDIETSYGLIVKADHFAHDIHLDHYDFLIIPGGRYVAENIEHDVHIKEIIKFFDRKNKMIAAICAGPRFLGRTGILDGKQFTAFTGSEKDAQKGIYCPEKKAVRDGHIITARGAGAVYEFAYEIVSYLLGEEKAKQLLASILY